MKDTISKIKVHKQPVLIFLLLTVIMAAGGYVYSVYHMKDHTKQTMKELESVASLKESQIDSWLGERISDAQNITDNPYIGERIEQLLRSPSTGPIDISRFKWMTAINNLKQYRNVLLLDQHGLLRMQTGQEVNYIGPETAGLVRHVINSKMARFSDFYFCTEHRTVHLDVLAPIIRYGKPGDPVLGIMILRIDPEQLLYPLIKQWPVPSKTAETYLVRREGREVIYLTDLKRRKDTALKFKLPLEQDKLPEVMAIQGREGSVTGRDYAGQKVYANIHAIPNSPWFIIAKMDMAEANSSAYTHLWFISLILLAMIIAAGGIIGFWWNRQQKKYLHQQLDLTREKQALSRHYEYLTKYANDIILLLDDKLNIIEANERALNTYGYSDQLLEMSIYNLRVSEQGLSIEDQYRKVVDENGLVFETVHKKKDSITFPVEISARMINVEGKKYFQAIIRDITERKRTQEILQTQKNELETANQELLITNRKLESTQKELKAAAVRWESTFDAIGDGLSILDNDFNILQCNIQFSSLVKKPFGQIIGQKCYQIIHGSQEPLPDCPVAKMQNSEKRETSEFEMGGRWLKIVADPIFDSRQQVIGSVHILSDITEWKRAEEKINASLKEKEVLLREIHHRVKNNLQIISSLLNLQSGYIQDQRAQDLFKECQTRVRSMSLIHERLYQSESLSNIKFSEYVKILIDDLFHSYGVDTDNVSYSLDVIDLPIKIDTAIPCGLIVNELISNSLKYAFPGHNLLKKKGKINIKLAQEDAGKFILEIADNGIGLPKGFDLRKAETLGLQLVATLVEQLEGKIEIKGNKGAVFTIRFEEK